MIRKSLDIYNVKVSVDSEEMTFTGYASTFGNVDSYGDIIAKGAFLDSIAGTKQGNWPVLLSQHGFGSAGMSPIGLILSLDEDENGLLMRAKFAETEAGLEMYKLMKMDPRPAISGLSIGFRIPSGGSYKQGDNRIITNAALAEVSVVTFPANTLAQVSEVRSSDITERDIERALRDAGLSCSMAKTIISKGFKAAKRSERDAGAPEDAAEKRLISAVSATISLLKS